LQQIAVGTDRVSWWRIAVGGSLAGAAICGMHYLGNASILNYTSVYSAANVVGSALIAVAASNVALTLFFVFRAAWTNSWWKRFGCAIVLAGAVSGMHWCASMGTQYRLLSLDEGNNQLSRNTTVIVVICLSIGAALIIVALAAYSTHVSRRYADKAQQIVLAAAVFDKSGRILVNPDGLLPSEKVTDTYLEKTQSDEFSIGNPLFHWMFQVSRNWTGISSILHTMGNHLAQLPRAGRDGKVTLVDDNGKLIENYDVIFKELFCLAAVSLADKMKENITNVGALWDEILPTGAGTLKRYRHAEIDTILDRESKASSPRSSRAGDDLAEKGEHWGTGHLEISRGSLMFLVRRLENPRDAERLEAAGFRFAEVAQVSNIIGTSMQIKARDLPRKLQSMARYADENTMMEPGVHVGFFGVRARVYSHGFEVLVQKGARNLMPSMQMPLERLEPWQVDFIHQLDRMSVPALCLKLDAMKKLSPREMLFASQLCDTVEALRAWVDDPIFDEAILTSKIVQAPCYASPSQSSSSPANTCTLITLRMVIPIHAHITSPKCEFVPLSLFKIHQMVYKDSPQHAAFARSVHRDILPIISTVSLAAPSPTFRRGRRGSLERGRFSPFARFGRSTPALYPVDGDGNPIPTAMRRRSGAASNHSDSTVKLWSGSNHDTRPSDAGDRHRSDSQGPAPFGGIMVSQEIKVDVEEGASHVETQRIYHNNKALPARPSDIGMSNSDRVTIVTAAAPANLHHQHLRGASFEMNSMDVRRPDATRVNSGSSLAKATIGPGTVSEDESVSTFVDELFIVCVDGR
jgi:hypothetical protein